MLLVMFPECLKVSTAVGIHIVMAQSWINDLVTDELFGPR